MAGSLLNSSTKDDADRRIFLGAGDMSAEFEDIVSAMFQDDVSRGTSPVTNTIS
jgi:hypothetical protein